MTRGFRNVDALVDVEKNLLVFERDPGSTCDDDPMFGTMQVHLIAEPRPGIDRHVFDLVVWPLVQNRIMPPGPVGCPVLLGFDAVPAFKFVDHIAHFLCFILVADEGGVIRVDNDKILQPDGGENAFVPVKDAIPVVKGDNISAQDVSPNVTPAPGSLKREK